MHSVHKLPEGKWIERKKQHPGIFVPYYLPHHRLSSRLFQQRTTSLVLRFVDDANVIRELCNSGS